MRGLRLIRVRRRRSTHTNSVARARSVATRLAGPGRTAGSATWAACLSMSSSPMRRQLRPSRSINSSASRGAPRSGSVIREAASRERVPDVDDRLNDAPAGFNHVGALEERRVTSHAIAQEALVAGAVFNAEIIAVVEVHVDEAELHHGAGNFRAEAERDAFFRLDVNDQTIRFEIFHAWYCGRGRMACGETG